MGGIGAVPVGYIVCNDEKSMFYGKFIPYEPHAKVVLWIFTRFIELGYDFPALRKEVREMSVVFPAFLPGVPIMRFMLTPTEKGYLISEDTLRDMLTNEVYTGTFRRQIQDGEVYIEKNHPTIVPNEIFWSVYDHLKNIRPDGTPTGRAKQVRYNQEKTNSGRQALLKVVSEDGGVYWNSSESYYNYRVIKRCQLGLHDEHVFSIEADALETAVVKRLFERLHTIDLNNLNEQRAERKVAINKKIRELKREVETINEDITTLTENMKKIKTESVIQELEVQMAKAIVRRTNAEASIAQFEQALTQDTLGTLEEELEDLEALWQHKPFSERKALLSLLIKSLSVKFLSQHLYNVEICWNYDNWGIESAIFYRGTSGSKDWTNAELAVITKLYPTSSHIELLRALPTRTWATIGTRAYQMGIIRTVKLPMPYPKSLTLQDIEWLERNNLAVKDFHEYKYNLIVVNQTRWN